MASGKVKDPRSHVDFYGKDALSQWFTLYSGFTVGSGETDATLRKVGDNLWNFYLAVVGTTISKGAPTGNRIGKFSFSFFGGHPVAGYIPAVIGNELSEQIPAVAKLAGSSGDLTICTPTAFSNKYVYIHGIFIVREDTNADNET